MAPLSKKYADKNRLSISKHWPEVKQEDLWHPSSAIGYKRIPRTLGLIMSLIDGMTKGAPAGQVYCELWCRAPDEMYISLNKKEEMAFFSGCIGQRGMRMWQDRMKKLEQLGFIKTASGVGRVLSHAVLLNPYGVLKELKKKKTPGLSNDLYDAFVERAQEIGAMA